MKRAAMDPTLSMRFCPTAPAVTSYYMRMPFP